jgi:hypothetical protein
MCVYGIIPTACESLPLERSAFYREAYTMDKPGSVIIIVLLGLLAGCGFDDTNETQDQAPQAY